jgi:hypothetical protein
MSKIILLPKEITNFKALCDKENVKFKLSFRKKETKFEIETNTEFLLKYGFL